MQTTSNSLKMGRMVMSAAITVGALGLTAAWLLQTFLQGFRAWDAGGPLRPDEALVPLVAAAALGVALWLCCGVVLELLARLLPGTVGRCAESAAAVITPRAVRRVAAALLGLGMTAGLSPAAASVAATAPGPGASVAASPQTPVHAASAVPGPGRSSPTHAEPELPALPDPGFGSIPDAGWVPSAPTVRPQPDVRVLSPAPRAPAPEQEEHEVVVHRGDSLWSIAADHLGPGASDDQIADAWPAWYAANREVIGADPHFLLPGQVLRAPEAVRP